MTDAKKQLNRGLIWLGSAAAVGRIADALSMVAVLFFLTKEEIGVATIAWAIGMMLEAICRLGLGVAILQAKEVSRIQLDTSFWLMTFTSIALGLVAVGTGPYLGPVLHEPRLAIYLIPAAIKIVFLVWAEIPIQLMNRDLQFASIAGVNTGATFLAAIARVALAATGFGAWTLLIAHALYGVFVWLVAVIVRPFWPRLRFQLAEIRDFLRFGKYVTGDWLARELYRNADYLILGSLTGPGVVGVYRVAFDIAMMPAMALSDVLGRSALPVMARLRRQERADIFLDASGKLATMMGALSAVIISTAVDVTAIFQNGEYAAAALPAQLLAVAAAMRTLYQLFPELFNAAGFPRLTFRFALISLAVLGACLSISLVVIGVDDATIALSMGWIAVYPVLLPLAVWTSSDGLYLRPTQYWVSLVAPASSAIVACAAGLWMHSMLVEQPTWWARIGFVATTTLFVYSIAHVGFGRLVEALRTHALPVESSRESSQRAREERHRGASKPR